MSKTAAQKPNLVLYNPQGHVPLAERKTAALELMTCKAPEVVIKGPAGTGKSLALLHRGNAVLSHYPGARGLLVRKTRASLTESALVTYETRVVPRNLAVYPDTQATQRKIRHSYEYPNGSVLVVAGMDTPERVLSTEFDIILCPQCEELTENDWELLMSRLRNYKIPGYQQIVGDMNPAWPNHWLNRRIREGKTKVLLSRHEDNPLLFNADGTETEKGAMYLDKLRASSGVRYLRYYKGVDAAAEGIVYPEFDAAKHVLNPIDPKNAHIIRGIRGDWRKIRVIDFGFRHPFVCGWFAISPDGVIYRYREIFYSNRIVEDHAKQIKKYSYDEIIEASIADHDAEDRATLHKHGIKTKPAFKSVKLGIEAVQTRIRDNRFFIFSEGEVDGRVYGRVERDQVLVDQCRPDRTIDEYDVYAYPEAKAGTAGKEDPVKEFDDGQDTNRYLVCEVDDVSRRRFKLRGGRVGKLTAA